MVYFVKWFWSKKIFDFFYSKKLGQSTSIAKKKPESSNVYNPFQNALPPKPKKMVEKESENVEVHNKNWNMSEDEKNVYGDRMIENYEKLDLLGKYFRTQD